MCKTQLCVQSSPSRKEGPQKRRGCLLNIVAISHISLKPHWFCEDRILRVDTMMMRGVCNYAKSLLSIQVQQMNSNVHLCLAK